MDAIAKRQGLGAVPEAANEVTTTGPLSLEVQVIDGEPRVLDTDLATQLGMARATNIRSDLIMPNREELEGFGILQELAANSGQRGKPSKAFYLNRQQALLVCILSKTPKAREVRAKVVRRFDAYEVPQVAAPLGIEQLMATMTASMTTAIAQAMQAALQASGKAPVVEPQAKRVIPEKPRTGSARALELPAIQYPHSRGCGNVAHGGMGESALAG